MTQIQYIHIAFEIWGAIFCAIAAVCVYVTRQLDKKEAFALISILVTETIFNISEALAYYYRGNETEVGYVMVRVTNFIVFVCGYLLATFAFKYMARLIENRSGNKNEIWRKIFYGLSASGIILLILSRIFNFYYAFDEQNRYYRMNESYWIMSAIGVAMLILLFVMTMKNRKYFQKAEFIAFTLIETAPIVGLIVQLLNYGVSILNLVNTIMILLLFTVYEMNYGAALVRREREISEERLRMYHGQIQPHFIYNSLSVIRSLLPEQTEAKNALDEFSRFLRGSLDMFMETECITAKQEIKTVENYLKMERRRFEDKLTIKLEVEDTRFLLPTFTVQILVENAIKHGIRKRKDGRGKLTIKIYETREEHIIEVADDGVGFDVSILNELDEKKRLKHVGLVNLKERLNLMCSGKLEINSIVGKGTNVKVKIPK